MKRLAIMVMVFSVLGCAPVLRKDFLERGVRDVPLSTVIANPAAFTDRLFVLGGVIISSKATAEGTLIEAIFVPVNGRGYLEDISPLTQRFLALSPKSAGFLDPAIYAKGRSISLAGAFKGLRSGFIDEMDYAFPFFEIEEVYLWPEERYPPVPYPYWGYPYYPYPPYYSPWPYDPWWYGRPYPWYPYW